MKIWKYLLTALLLLGTLTACGGNNNNDASGTIEVDLNTFFTGLEETYGWDENYLADIDSDLLENYYPGLGDLTVKQLVAKAPMMSAVVNEMVFLQCEDEDEAIKAEKILQDRIDYQVGDDTNPGGAWYPASIESWKQAKVIRHGTYVALVASAENQQAIEDAFDQLFAG